MANSTLNSTVPRQFGLQSGNLIPARLDARQTAELLGFEEQNIRVLVAAKMLRPLGKPVPNAQKFFAACEVNACAANAKWLRDATQTVYDYWKDKNARKSAKVQQTKPDKAEISLTE